MKQSNQTMRRILGWSVGIAAVFAAGMFSAQFINFSTVPGPLNKKESNIGPLAFIQISGNVQAPKTIEIDSVDMTLRQALIQAGGPRQIKPTDDQADTWLVELSRDSDQQRDQYFFPLQWIDEAARIDVSLTGGDELRVVNLDDTSLGDLQSREAGLSFSVSGKIAQPGSYKTLFVSEKLGNIHTAEYAGSFGPAQADVMVVHRRDDGANLTQHYFIPLTASDVNPELLGCRIQAGDEIEYTRLEDLQWLHSSGR